MTEESLKLLRIDASRGLDPITVFWQNFGPSRGSVTVLCYDMAWTAYFGGMGDRTIQQFFVEVGSEYMTEKLVYAQFLKSTSGHKKYLRRIVDSIKAEIAEPVS